MNRLTRVPHWQPDSVHLSHLSIEQQADFPVAYRLGFLLGGCHCRIQSENETGFIFAGAITKRVFFDGRTTCSSVYICYR